MATWIDRINAALADELEWRNDADKAIEEFKKAGRGNANGFNVIWPNTVIKQAAVFSRVPEPVVRRRFRTGDPLSRDVSIMLERDLAYQWDIQPSKNILDRVALDFVLTGRGIARVRYQPEIMERFEPAEYDEDLDDFYIQGTEKVNRADLVEQEESVGIPVKEILSETAPIEHWCWDKFTHDPQARWCDVRWICFIHDMSEKEAKDSFGAGALRRMQASKQEKKAGRYKKPEKHQNSARNESTYTVYEVWDKEEKEVFFVHEGSVGKSEHVLGKIKDPYGLRDFFPTPAPLLLVPQPDSLCPITEYSLYESQAKELNVITNRSMRVNRRINPRMAYDAGVKDLANLLGTDDMQAVPIDNMSQYLERGGIDAAMFFLPIREFAEVASIQRAHIAELLNTIFQLTGLSDIIRGSSDPRETATAQTIKSQFGSLRLKPAQEAFQAFIADLMAMQSEIMAEKFELGTLAAMASVQPRPEMELLIRSDVRRNFAIEIETDSTLAMDESIKKQEMMEMTQALGSFVGQVQQAKALGLDNQAAAKMLKFFMSPWRPGRELEEEFDRLASQPRQEGPSPEQQQAQMDAQLKMMTVQQDAQNDQFNQALQVEKLGLDKAKEAHKQNIDHERLMLDALGMAI